MKGYRGNRIIGGKVVVALAFGFVVAWVNQAPAGHDVAAGQTIYKERCVFCHGENGAGDGPLGRMLKPSPPSFGDLQRLASRSDEELMKTIAEGKSPMPRFGEKLSVEGIKNVLAYIRTLAPSDRSGPASGTKKWKNGNEARGRE